jgi:hypothetical protein
MPLSARRRKDVYGKPGGGPRGARPTDRHVDGIHVLMGVAMAGMLVPRLRVFWIGGWEVIFGIGAVWFAGRGRREWRGP